MKTSSIFTEISALSRSLTRQNNRKGIFWIQVLMTCVILLSLSTSISGRELILRRAMTPPPSQKKQIVKPDQIPHSRVNVGTNNILQAWLADPTDRYKHGVLGDEIEAGALVVITRNGTTMRVDLPQNRVFEDLVARLVDIDQDGNDEIMVVETDVKQGASLAIYGIQQNKLKKISATPFLGKPYRWMNPIGVGDFTGDGHNEIAVIITPHIGGVLRLYAVEKWKLGLISEYPGVSNHKIGLPELGAGRIVRTKPEDLLILPTQSWDTLILLEWKLTKFYRIGEIRLPATLISSLTRLGNHQWRFKVANQETYVIQYRE